jgi:hypothetical protein
MTRDNDRIRDPRSDESDQIEQPDETERTPREEPPNPPRTTTGKWTSPKFGSAGSGGAELEPGPERD